MACVSAHTVSSLNYALIYIHCIVRPKISTILHVPTFTKNYGE